MIPKPRRLVSESAKKKVRRLACVCCHRPPPSDAAHIKSRGAGGDDVTHNLLPLCRVCHSAQHRRGWVWMIETYQTLRNAIKELGWRIEESKLRHWNE